MLQQGAVDFAYTGLFCHPEDAGAIQTGAAFQELLTAAAGAFRTITYQDWITRLQRLPLSWERRELSMLLWARYCGAVLSAGLGG